ncbi:MAG: 5'-nucleotidase C-terminal domain-containing protein [Pseudomonadota bacterium]
MKSVPRIAFVFSILISIALYADIRNIKILHFNDFHGYLTPLQQKETSLTIGGAAYLAHMIYKHRDKNSILVSAGDMYFGSTESNLNKGQAVNDIMNYLKLDAFGIGNHAFDFGVNALKDLFNGANFEFLACNLSGIKFITTHKIIEKNGLKLLIIGLLTNKSFMETAVEPEYKLKVSEPISSLKQFLNTLNNKYDAIIVLSHIGYSEDIELAKAIDKELIIIGGHTHTLLKSAEKINKSIIVQAGEHGKYLGILNLSFDNNNKIIAHSTRAIPIIASGSFDKKVMEIASKAEAEVTKKLEKVIAYAETTLDGARENVRTKETNLGNLVSDCFLQCSKAQIAITNGGAIRQTIDQGPVSLKKVYNVIPFQDALQMTSIKGFQLKLMLEHLLQYAPLQSGTFPQVSGLQLEYDKNKAPKERIKSIKITGELLKDDATYSMTTTEYIAKTIVKKPQLIDLEFQETCNGNLMWNILTSCFKEKKTLNQKLEDRIIEIIEKEKN